MKNVLGRPLSQISAKPLNSNICSDILHSTVHVCDLFLVVFSSRASSQPGQPQYGHITGRRSGDHQQCRVSVHVSRCAHVDVHVCTNVPVRACECSDQCTKVPVHTYSLHVETGDGKCRCGDLWLV